jgi:hypothetical protein
MTQALGARARRAPRAGAQTCCVEDDHDVFVRLTIYDDVDLGLEMEALEWASTQGRGMSSALPGYQGLLTLVDRDDRRILGISFYESEEDARRADGLLRGVLPESLPEELRRALPTRSYVGVLEVVERDGL